MIVELAVHNLALAEEVRVTLGPGFTALTGETGAGKSMLIGAIELALGARSDSDYVRTGARLATVSLTVDLAQRPDLVGTIEGHGAPLEGATLSLQREVLADGGSRCRVGGRLAPLTTVRLVGDALVDLHGQHDHQMLLNPSSHLGFLDDWIGAAAVDLRTEIARKWTRFQEANRRLETLRRGVRERDQRLDILRFQIVEISGAAPKPGETTELEALLKRLKNAEKLSQIVRGALEALAGREGSAHEATSEALRQLNAALPLDPQIDATIDPLQQSVYALEDALRALRQYVDGLDSDPETLESTAARIDLLRRLQRKYGDTDEEVLAFLNRANAEMELLEDASANEEILAQEATEAENGLLVACAALSDLRAEHAARFALQVQSELRDLAMEKARFEVRVEPRTPDEQGADLVEFFFSANPGEPPKSLSKIASGGEISRAMLAIKAAGAHQSGAATIVFDEVDAGLGGAAAAAVARKLEQLAKRYQVICITHLPQIAGRADAHWNISKRVRDGRTSTFVTELDDEGRVCEIARMIAGDSVTPAALASARELLSPRRT